MRPNMMDFVRGLMAGAIVAAGIGIGLLAGAAHAQDAGVQPCRTVTPLS